MHRRLLVCGVGDLGIKFMLDKKLQEIFDKYNKKSGGNWLAGNFIPSEEDEKYRIMFIGEKPSDFLVKYGDLKCLGKCLKDLGNYNATFVDMGFQGFLKRYNLGKVYITDMVKTEGKAGADFELEWNSDFKGCLKEEIDCYEPKLIVFISTKAEKLFKNSFNDLGIETFRIHHPSYLCKKPHDASVGWYRQFEGIVKRLK